MRKIYPSDPDLMKTKVLTGHKNFFFGQILAVVSTSVYGSWTLYAPVTERVRLHLTLNYHVTIKKIN